MYGIRIERAFCAAHSLRIGGEREPVHGHNWIVRVELEGREVDDDGLLYDFHAAERALDEVVGAFHNRNLNEIEPFDRLNPSAELLARHIAVGMEERIGGNGVRVSCVSVREAPGCWARYLPEP